MDERGAYARRWVAVEAINYVAHDFGQVVRRITGKLGVDVVVEHVGAATWEKSLASLARRGRLATCGATTGNDGAVNIWTLFAKELSVIGAYGGTRADPAAALGQVAAGRHGPVVSPLAAPRALAPG